MDKTKFSAILSEYKKYLESEGYLLLEIGYDQAKSVGKLINSNYNIIKDLAGNDRVVIVEGGWKIVIFIRSKARIK